MGNEKVQLFEDQPIRTAWVEDEEEWYFSIVDVVGALTEQPDHDGARNYWKVLKSRMKEEGNELVTNCNQLKMTAVPSKKAEPLKLWLAKVGRERMEEVIDPELTINGQIGNIREEGTGIKCCLY